MFPVRVLLCHLEGTPHYSETEIQDLFAEDAYDLGCGKYRGSMTMTGGPLGTGLFYQYFFDPKTLMDLALLVEYSTECHHGFAVVVMRDRFLASALPTPLTMSEHGHWLDTLPPPEAYPLDATNRQIDFDWQREVVTDWNLAKEYIETIEIENRELRARLGDK